MLALLPEYINKMAEHVLPFCKMGRASVDGSLKVLFGCHHVTGPCVSIEIPAAHCRRNIIGGNSLISLSEQKDTYPHLDRHLRLQFSLVLGRRSIIVVSYSKI